MSFDALLSITARIHLGNFLLFRGLNVGELELLREPGMPRKICLLAIVDKVFVSRDGHVRSALLRTRVNKLHRPITQIVPLEVDTA